MRVLLKFGQELRINDIREKIEESLNGGGKCNQKEPKNPLREKKMLADNNETKRKCLKEEAVGKFPKTKRYRSKEREQLAKEISEELGDGHSLGAFRIVVDKIPEQRIRIFLSIIKDTYLSRKIKKSRGAMFISLAKDYASKNNINLNFR